MPNSQSPRPREEEEEGGRPTARLDALPTELLIRILHHLHCGDLFRLERVSKTLQYAIERHCWRHWHRVEWDEGFLRQNRALECRPTHNLSRLLSAILDRCGSHVTELYLDQILWRSATLQEPKLLVVPEVFRDSRPLPALHTLDLTGITTTCAADLIHISAHVGATLKCLNLVDILIPSARSSAVLASCSSYVPPDLNDASGEERPLVFSCRQFALFLKNMPLLERLGVSLNGSHQMAHLSFEEISPVLKEFVSRHTSLHPNVMGELAERCGGTLEALTLTHSAGVEWSEIPVEAINLFLTKATRLRRIELAVYRLNSGLRAIDADNLPGGGRSLEELVLSGYLMIPLTGKFSNVRKLKIDCYDAPLDAEALQLAFGQLENLMRLEVFSVIGCRLIADDHLNRLAMRGRIKELRIIDCPLVTTASIELFLRECKGLRRLESDDSLLTNDILSTLQSILDEKMRQGSQMERVAFLHYDENSTATRSCNMHPWIVFSEGDDEDAKYRRLRLG